MNFAFIIVVVATASGLASEFALRSVAPDTGPALALVMMAIALIVAAWGRGAKPVRKVTAQSGALQLEGPAGESFHPA